MPQLAALTSAHVLNIQLPPHLPSLRADEQRIAQVLTNLVNNATKFSPLNTQITLSAYRSGGEVQVDVADEGQGIPPAEREHIFHAFHQLENGRQNASKGAGLGLAICKGLIEAHKGRIWLQDRAGGGTVFSFTLPANIK
jgi:two-component system sensor histidine kinase KdpD